MDKKRHITNKGKPKNAKNMGNHQYRRLFVAIVKARTTDD